VRRNESEIVILQLASKKLLSYLAHMTKQELRKLYKEKRKCLSAKERMKLDDLLLIQFQKIDVGFAQTLLTYHAMETHAEPNTDLFTHFLEFRIPGLQIAYPVTDVDKFQLHPKLVNDQTEFTTTAFGIEEPMNGKDIDAAAIDIVFVPMLIYDVQGYRVGFGKGFYDRFLPNCREDVLKVGFSYFEPVDKIDDANEFDIPLSLCITPEKIYEFGSD
jgi:5-formyltetrahydrofolate cyclo-ligase